MNIESIATLVAALASLATSLGSLVPLLRRRPCTDKPSDTVITWHHASSP